MPGVEFGSGIYKRFQSLPDGLYGRIYYNPDINSEKHLVANIIKDFLDKSSYSKIYLYDYYNELNLFNDFQTIDCSTNIVDVSSSDYMPPDKKLQSEIRKADRENIFIERFNADKHFDKFINLMKATEKRHQRKPKYPERFFKELAKLAQTDNRILWYWCEHENQAVNSHINFIENEMVINWYVCYDKSFSFLKANQKILYSMIKEIQSPGIRHLNLGASPEDAGSLLDYKEKWGGETYHYKCYYRKSGLGKLF